MSSPAPEPVDVAPSLEEVAALARARTTDPESGQEGEWTENTRPSADQVSELIEEAEAHVKARSAQTFYEPCAGAARHSILLYTCCLIEISYYPEQINEDASAFARFKELFDEAIEATVSCVTGAAGADGVTSQYGWYSIPMTAVGADPYGVCTDLLPGRLMVENPIGLIAALLLCLAFWLVVAGVAVAVL